MSRASSDLETAMSAVKLVSDGPNLDEVTEELIARRRKATPSIDIERLEIKHPLGMGGQGGVWLGHDPASGLRMAVKQIRKGRLTTLPKKAMTRALTERQCLLEVGLHPFITVCYACFQNDTSLFFALELAPAGDLFGLLDTHPSGVPELNARFFVTCIALALRHVHANGWVYRDVKLENVLLDSDGYCKICDFGFAKYAASDRTFTKCGTDEYAPPEVVSGRGRSYAADWWALGVLLHEMLTGRPPFEGNSAEEIFACINDFSMGGASAVVELQEELLNANSNTSPKCASFLGGLLNARESDRIGAGPGGFIEIQVHDWFKKSPAVDWEATLRREVPAPWVPPASDDAVDAGYDLTSEKVMQHQPYDNERWSETFQDFGPYRRTPWPSD